MRVTSLRIKNFRSILDMAPIDLGPINVLVGPNNAGKSSLLRALYAIQDGAGSFNPDIRSGSTSAQVTFRFDDVDSPSWEPRGVGPSGHLVVTIKGHSLDLLYRDRATGEQHLEQLPAREPGHFIVPFLAKRKVAVYDEDVRESHALQVTADYTFLGAKLSRLSTPTFPAYEQYATTCKAILGFVVTSIPSPNGQHPGVYVSATETIPLEQMGEGVPQIVGLLAYLALSRGKLFLIEEPENDLHPAALKQLLELVVKSSKYNQFVVSTHSSIVARHLGAVAGSRLFHVDVTPGELPPVARVELIEPTPAARMKVLRELGYELSDFDLWDGWLILEESSAERIIRDYLVPWFAPKLSRVRTLATAGNRAVEPTFADFHRLVRFTHLEEAYRNRAWVLIDGDEEGQRIVDRLRESYGSWSPDRFVCLDQPQFERYYPAEFSERVNDALAVEGRDARRAAKHGLLEELRAWLDQDESRARDALEASAGPVIAELRRIESQLMSAPADSVDRATLA